jgi:hypothetical protein
MVNTSEGWNRKGIEKVLARTQNFGKTRKILVRPQAIGIVHHTQRMRTSSICGFQLHKDMTIANVMSKTR